MTHVEDLKKQVENLAATGGDKLEKTASELIDDGVKALEKGLERGAEELEAEIHDALHPRRRIPWLKIATGVAVVAGIVYLARHRAQRETLQKGIVKGIQGGAVLALMLPGTVRKARKSAEHLIDQSEDFLEKVGDRIPVRVVMK